MRNLMRKFSAMTINAMLAGATVIEKYAGAPPYQYRWWDKGQYGEPQWRGG